MEDYAVSISLALLPRWRN